MTKNMNSGMCKTRLLIAATLTVACGVVCVRPTPLYAATTPFYAATTPPHAATDNSLTMSANATFCRRALALQQAALSGLLSLVGGAGAGLPAAPLSCGPAATAPAARTALTHSASAARSHATHGGTARPAHASSQPLHLPAYTPLGSSPSGAIDTSSLLGLAAKFTIVLVLLFLCLRVLRLVMPRLSGGTAAAGGMVLHSETIADKQRVQLLDLEVRLVLVAVSGANTTVLTTVDDVEEMATLRARYQPRAKSQASAARGAARPSTTGEQAGEQAERPSFASALALATQQKMPRRAMPSNRPRTPRLDSMTPAPEPTLNRALEALRALRRRAEGL